MFGTGAGFAIGGLGLVATGGEPWAIIGWALFGVGMLLVASSGRGWALDVVAAPAIAVEPEIHSAQEGRGEERRQILSVLIYNKRKRGVTIKEVVPTIEARFLRRLDDDEAALQERLTSGEQDHSDLILRGVRRGHGLWIKEPFARVSSLSLGGDSKRARRKDFAPTGEREPLALLVKYANKDFAEILDPDHQDGFSRRGLGRGRWRLDLTFQGVPSVRRVPQFEFELVNYGKNTVILSLVERPRLLGIGLRRTHVIASSAATWPATTFRQRFRRWFHGQAP